MKDNFPELKQLSVKIHEKLIKLGILMIETIDSVDILRVLMHDKFIDGYKVIDLISLYNLTDLLET